MRWPLVDTHHADGPRGTDDVDQPVQDELRVLLAGRVVGLVAHGLHAAVDAVAVGRVHDLLDRVALREVDRCRAVRLGQLETVGDLVHDEHLGGAEQEGAVRRHQSDRAGAVHGNAVPYADLCEHGSVEAGREDVGEHREVGLVLGALRQVQQVEVGVGDAQESARPPSYGPISA